MNRVMQMLSRTKSGESLKTIDPETMGNQKKKPNMILILLVFLTCIIVTLHLDNDIWFLLNSGRYVVQHGIPTIEPFTLHENFSFLMQQWLSATIFWEIYSKLGAIGILALVFLFFCAIVAVTYLLTWHISGGNQIAAFIATMITSAALKPVMVSRPIIFTLFILVCELYFVERFISSSKLRYLIPLPLFSALLINLHAAMWPIQFVILLPYIIDAFRFKVLIIQGQGYPKRFFFPAIGLMFAAGFLNPYGWDAMTYVFRSYGYQEITMVLEMKPADINQVSGMLIFGLLFLILAIYMVKKERKTRIRYVLLSLGTAVLALSSVRSFSLYAACGIFPLAYFLKDVTLPQSKIKTEKGVMRLRVVLIALVTLTVAGLLIQRVSAFDEDKETPTVVQAVNYLKEHESTEDMVLYTGYNEGGFVEYMGLKPYIDPRAEVFVQKNNKTDDVMKEYYSLETGQIYYKTVLDKYQFTHILTSHDDVLYVYLPHDSDYQLIYEDSEYLIYRHR